MSRKDVPSSNKSAVGGGLNLPMSSDGASNRSSSQNSGMGFVWGQHPGGPGHIQPESSEQSLTPTTVQVWRQNEGVDFVPTTVKGRFFFGS